MENSESRDSRFVESKLNLRTACLIYSRIEAPSEHS